MKTNLLNARKMEVKAFTEKYHGTYYLPYLRGRNYLHIRYYNWEGNALPAIAITDRSCFDALMSDDDFGAADFLEGNIEEHLSDEGILTVIEEYDRRRARKIEAYRKVAMKKQTLNESIDKETESDMPDGIRDFLNRLKK